jgi:hypothetical protein
LTGSFSFENLRGRPEINDLPPCFPGALNLYSIDTKSENIRMNQQ